MNSKPLGRVLNGKYTKITLTSFIVLIFCSKLFPVGFSKREAVNATPAANAKIFNEGGSVTSHRADVVVI